MAAASPRGKLFSVPSFRFELLPTVGKYSRIATFGVKSKEGEEMVFSEATLGQMVDNWASRGDKLAMCLDHESALTPMRRAPAAAFFNALALFSGGALVKYASLDPAAEKPNAKDDRGETRDGLYARLAEVTPLGADPTAGLANYAFISPMFTSEGAKEDGTPIGYDLADIAATNNPFQAGCAIEFHKVSPGERVSLQTPTKRYVMDKEMRKSLGLADDASPEECMAAMASRLKKYDDDAAELKKLEDEKAKGGGGEEDEKFSDDAEVMADDKDDAPALAKMAKALGFSGKTSPAKMQAALSAKMVPMSDVAKVQQELAQLKQSLEVEKKAEQDRALGALADRAIAIGYDKAKRESFISYARVVGVAEAEEFLKTLPGKVATQRFTRAGAPVGKGAPAEAAGDEEGDQEIGAELAKKARAYAKEHFNKVDGPSLRKAYIALGRVDNSYAESIDRLRKSSVG